MGDENHNENFIDWKYAGKNDMVNKIKTINDIELIRSHFMFEELPKSDDYFLLSVIRNPVDMFYSEFYYHVGKKSKSIDDFINKLENWRIDYIKNVIETCDYVGVFENMDKTVNDINTLLGTNIVNDVKINVNKTVNKNDYLYRRNEVEHKCKEVLDIYFDYCDKFIKI